MSLEDLKSKLASLKSTSVFLSSEEEEELKLLRDVEAEESRIAAEKARKRAVECSRILEAARRKMPADQQQLIELIDLDQAGVFVMRPPSPQASDAFQDAIKDKGSASSLDQANFVLACMVYPDPAVLGTDVRETFDRFTFAPQTLVNVALRLGGLKVEMRQKK